MSRKVGVVCTPSAFATSTERRMRQTFQSADDTQYGFVPYHMLDDAGLVEENKRLHDVAELVQARKIFQVFCYFHQTT